MGGGAAGGGFRGLAGGAIAAPMELAPTLALAAALGLAAVVAGWLGARPPDPLKGPRLVPYRLIMLLAAAGLVVTVAHLANLLGLAPGR